MRHLLSVLLAIVLAPVVYIASGVAASALTLTLDISYSHVAMLTIGFVAAAVAGGLYAVLLMARLSPLGPALAGLALAGVTVWSAVTPFAFHHAMPASVAGVSGGILVSQAGALTAVLAVPLLATLAIPRRWRRTVVAGTSTQPDATTTPLAFAPSQVDTLPYEAPLYTPHAYGASTPGADTMGVIGYNDPEATTRF